MAQIPLLPKKKLRRELEETLKRGVAIDNEELATGLCCIASPVLDHTSRAYYAISLSAPAIRFTAKRVDKIQPVIKTICGKLSEKIGNTNLKNN